MERTINFNELIEINQLLKDKNYEYSIHGTPGCASCGVELRGENEEISSEELCAIINEYLKMKWLRVEPIAPNSYYLNVKSL